MANNIYTNQKNVTASGTPVKLPAQSVDGDQSILIKAKTTNTGIITVGNSSDSALNSGSGHFKLAAGEALELSSNNSGNVWIDATVSGEGVEILIG